VKGSTSCGASVMSGSASITLNPKPSAAGAVTGTTTVCAGTKGVVYSVAAITNAKSYVWIIPAGVTVASGAGTTSITVNYGTSSSSGTIKVYGSNDCGIGTASPELSVTVKPITPTPVITRGIIDTLVSSADAGNQWYLNGNLIPGATGKKYRVKENGNYTVVSTGANGCPSDPSAAFAFFSVGVINQPEARTFDIYPNPNQGQFKIRIESVKKADYTIGIYNSVGSKVWGKDKVTIDGTYTGDISLKGLPTGVYTVILRNKAESIVKKVIVMNQE
jgi:hypothetical protein